MLLSTSLKYRISEKVAYDISSPFSDIEQDWIAAATSKKFRLHVAGTYRCRSRTLLTASKLASIESVALIADYSLWATSLGEDISMVGAA